MKMKKKIIIMCVLLIIAAMYFGLSVRPSDISSDLKELAVNTRYEEMKEMNSDYLGWLEFESGLISQPVVQTTDNQYYLTHDMNQNEFSQGTVFADKICKLDDQNITIYGHYVYEDENAMFSPLTILKEEKNYPENHILTLELQDEIRNYEIAMVYIFDMTVDTEYPYMTPDFDTPEDFKNFIDYADRKKFYDTGIEIEENDKILTLQTCVRNEDYQRLIVVAKEISRDNF